MIAVACIVVVAIRRTTPMETPRLAPRIVDEVERSAQVDLVAPTELAPEPIGAPPDDVAPPARNALSRTAAPRVSSPTRPAQRSFRIAVCTQTHDSLLPNHAFALDARDAEPGAPPLYRGRTDAQGNAIVELAATPDLVLDEKGRLPVTGRMLEPGFSETPVEVKAPRSGSQFHRLTLIATAGCTIRGRVVDTSGSGIEAVVSLQRWKVWKDGRQLTSRARTTSRPDGAFALDVDATDGILWADAADFGFGATTLEEFDPLAPPRDVTIVVRGASVLRGRVSDGLGTPAAGLDVLVLLAALDDGTGHFEPPEPACSLRKSDGLGQVRVRATADADGRFEVRGLRAGAYVVRARAPKDRQYPHTTTHPILLTQRPVSTDGPELELVFGRPHLVVQLLDPAGDPRVHRPGSWLSDGLWFNGSDVRLVVLELDSVRDVAGHPRSSGTSVGVGQFVYEVTPDREYVVGAIGGGFPSTLERVRVPPTGGRIDVVLREQNDLQLGRAIVAITSESAPATDHSFRVTLEDLLTRAILHTARPKQASVEFEVPPGRYRVVAEGHARTGHHGDVHAPRELGRSELEIEIAASRETRASLELTEGGSLRLRVRDSARPSGGGEPNASPSPDRARTADVFVQSEGRRPEPVYRRDTHRSFTYRRTSAWPLGSTHTSLALPTGRFELVGRLPDGREARAVVEIRSGETTEVTLWF